MEVEVEDDVPYWLFSTSSRSSQLLAVLGFVFILQKLKLIYDLIVRFTRVYSPSFYRPYKYIHKYGDWAALTGCTAGIGLGLARELAKRGMHLVLISRNEQKLRSLANEIQTEFKVEVKIITNDAISRQDTSELAKQLSQLDIGILVNNVGISFSEDIPYIYELSPDQIVDMITVNMGNSAILMKHVLPNMIKARKGCVINMSSMAGYVPLPLITLYCSTKVYLDVLSKSLREEVISTGVTVQSMCPLFVKSDMILKANEVLHNVLSISASTYASSVLNMLGTIDSSSGFWLTDVIFALSELVNYEQCVQYIFYCSTSLLKDKKKK